MLLVGASAAEAAPWKRITTPDGSSTDQVALTRTFPGDILRVVWHHPTGPNTEDLLYTPISPAGAVGGTVPLLTGWTGFQNAALYSVNTFEDTRLHVFFGGQRSTDSSDPFIGLHDLTLSLQGSTVSQVSLALISAGGQAYGSPVAAAIAPNGGVLQAWAGTLGTWVHSGFDPAAPVFDFQAPLGNHGYDPGLAHPSGGDTSTMAWYSNATGHLGVYAQGVNADGSPAGSPLRMPGTSNMKVGMIGRTPIAPVFHSGGAVTYVAYATGYPALNTIRLWPVGSSSSRVIARTARTADATTTIAEGQGRLWIAWTDTVGGIPHVMARRSNLSGTIFGAAVDAGRPPNSPSIYRLDVSPLPRFPETALDLFANAAVGATPSTATWYRRIFPGLTLGADPGRLSRGKATAVLFRVLDAGDPVAGATVRAGGMVGVTGARGTVTLRIPGRPRPLRATAVADGYVGAALTLRLRR
jgi:hypothetical protein